MHVFLATPTYNGLTDPGFLDSLEQTTQHLQELGHKVEFLMVKGSCYVQTARNRIVQKFIDSGADCLVFLDDDLTWPDEAVVRLLEAPGDVVAGIYPLKQAEEAYPVVLYFSDPPEVQVTQRHDNCILAHSVPTGLLKITRQAILLLQHAHPDKRYDDDEGTAYDIFPQGVHEGRWVGEDFAFCRLWREIGGEIWVMPDVDFSHAGYAGNFDSYMRSLVAPKGDTI